MALPPVSRAMAALGEPLDTALRLPALPTSSVAAAWLADGVSRACVYEGCTAVS